MDIKDWEILEALSDELNLTKAAKKLYTSQPSLTYRLNKLEEEFDITILNRQSHGISFTKEGEYLVEYSKKMLEEYKKVKTHLKAPLKNDSNEVKIGISTTIAKYKLGIILSSLRENFVNIKFQIKTGTSSSELFSSLEKSQIDMAIVRGEVSWNEESCLLNEDPYGIITCYPYTKETLFNLPYIQLDSKDSISSHEYFHIWAKNNNIDITKIEIIKVNSNEAALEMVKGNFGFTVLPFIHTENAKQLYFHPLIKNNKENFVRNTYLIAKNNSSNSTLAVYNFLKNMKGLSHN